MKIEYQQLTLRSSVLKNNASLISIVLIVTSIFLGDRFPIDINLKMNLTLNNSSLIGDVVIPSINAGSSPKEVDYE